MGMPAQTNLPVTLHLSKDARAKLSERATATGQELAHYIEALVECVAGSHRTIEEISGPVYQRFLESGTTDEELSEELELAKHEMRAERQARQAS
jgi:hypothetical protein